MFKLNNRDTIKRCEACSKLTLKTPGVSIANFNIFHTFFRWGTHLYISRRFFHFLNFDFLGCCLEGKKWPKMENKNYIHHAPYLRNSIAFDDDFCLHLCKIMISPGIFFFIFSKFWFSGSYWGKRAKNGPKWQKILSVMLHISRTIHHMIVIFGTHV